MKHMEDPAVSFYRPRKFTSFESRKGWLEWTRYSLFLNGGTYRDANYIARQICDADRVTTGGAILEVYQIAAYLRNFPRRGRFISIIKNISATRRFRRKGSLQRVAFSQGTDVKFFYHRRFTLYLLNFRHTRRISQIYPRERRLFLSYAYIIYILTKQLCIATSRKITSL